jgi:hypothetical protein
MEETSIVIETKHRSIPVIHVHLALKTDDMKHLEKSVSERRSGLFPCGRKPPLTKYLVDRSIIWLM